MKKRAAVIILCFCLFNVYALTYDLSLGHRKAVVFDTFIYPQISVRSEHLSTEFRLLGTDQADLLFTYASYGKHFGFETGFHSQTVGFESLSLSPFADVTYTQEFAFTRLRLELGVQLSVLKTKYIKQFMFAVMPVFSAELEMTISNFVVSVYIDDHTINDMAWRNYPVAGARLTYIFNPSLRIYAEAWARATEYLVDNWLMISSTGIRFGVRFER